MICVLVLLDVILLGVLVGLESKAKKKWGVKIVLRAWDVIFGLVLIFFGIPTLLALVTGGFNLPLQGKILGVAVSAMFTLTGLGMIVWGTHFPEKK